VERMNGRPRSAGLCIRFMSASWAVSCQPFRTSCSARSRAVSHSAGLLDALVWSVVALVAQALAFTLVERLLLPDWRAGMLRGEMAYGALGAAVAVAVGILNAACLTP